MLDLTQLNPEQYSAVTATNPRVLVLAGAGSGKTKALTFNIAYQIQLGLPAKSILAVTFTNKAAQEMVHRIGAMGINTKGIWVGTFHSICCRILRIFAKNLGMINDFTIYDDDDSKSVIKKIMRELGLNVSFQDVKRIAGRISDWKNELKTANRVMNDFQGSPNGFEKEAIDIYAAYSKTLQKNNAMDFDDLILKTVQVLYHVPEAKAWAHGKFSQVLVDEYQDINRAQYILIQQLLGPQARLWVCGDPDQSIYRFRGADISNILRFQQDYPQAQICRLERNYRSTETIVNAADAIVANNKGRLPKKSYSLNGSGNKIRLKKVYDSEEEAILVADLAKYHVSLGVPYNRMAILFRTNAQSFAIEQAMLAENVPYTIVGGISFYQRKEIKDLVAYLQLIANPFDANALKRTLGLQAGIGPKTIESLLLTANGSLIDECYYSNNKKVKIFGEKLREIQDLAVMNGPTDVLKSIITRMEYMTIIAKEDPATVETKTNNIAKLIELSEGYSLITEFLTNASLSSVNDKDGPGLKLQTLHSAKGLEFDVTFLIGAEEGLIPHQNSIYDEQAMEEERRLMYVGVTRAEKQVYIIWVEKRQMYGETRRTELSRFVHEIPREFIEASHKDWN